MHYDTRHGSPWDRGTADSWYSRGYNPHYFVGGSYDSPRIDLAEMTAEEIAAYTAGYEHNEATGDKKEWGNQ